MLPRINANNPYPFIPVIFVKSLAAFESLEIATLFIKKSESMIKGNIAGISEERQRLMETPKDCFITFCFKMSKINITITSNAEKMFFHTVVLSELENLFILHTSKHIML